ncbi:MAG: hypothetical protein [Caudoviricetes sp.]|nr:MAG: hypothetical protein [Caudoviricetes sp.]
MVTLSNPPVCLPIPSLDHVAHYTRVCEACQQLFYAAIASVLDHCIENAPRGVPPVGGAGSLSGFPPLLSTFFLSCAFARWISAANVLWSLARIGYEMSNFGLSSVWSVRTTLNWSRSSATMRTVSMSQL